MRRIALAWLLFFGQTQAWALPMAAGWGDPADPYYDAVTNPLSSAVRHLLIDNHYFVHSDGSIWAPLGEGEIRASQMRVLIRRLKSSERLKALLNIDLILSADGSQGLTPDDFKKMRHILKLAWPYFTLENRKHFARYFSREELYAMNATPPDEEADPDLLAEAPLGTPSQAAAPLPQETAPISSAQGPAAIMPTLNQPAPFFPQSAQLPAPSPAAFVVESAPAAPLPPPAQPSPVPVAIAPVVVAPPQPVAPAPSLSAPIQVASALPLPSVIAAAVVGGAASHAAAVVSQAPLALTSTVANLAPRPLVAAPQIAKTSNAIVVSSPSAIAPDTLKQILATSSVLRAPVVAVAKSSVPVSLPPLKPASLAPVNIVSVADFEKFLLGVPYSDDAKGLLRLIAADAQEPFRSRALNTVMSLVPAISLDADETGLNAHSKVSLKEKPNGEREAEIALNPTPILSFRREFLFEEWRAMLPSSSSTYKTLGLPVPHVEALDSSAQAKKTEAGPWGQQTQVYSDDSLRGNFSTFELAGVLLNSLLNLQAKIEGWSAFSYQEQSYAYIGQMLFYAQVKDGAKTADFLDPQMRALFEDWLKHPARFHDFLIHSLSSGRNSLWDLRHIETSQRDYFIRKSYIACPQSLKDAESLQRSSRLEALKKGAMSLARAHLDAASDFKQALDSLDSRAEESDSTPQSSSEAACATHWQKEFAGSNMIDDLLSEAAAAEGQFRKKIGALYVP